VAAITCPNKRRTLHRRRCGRLSADFMMAATSRVLRRDGSITVGAG
jgi:hypothetical protein